MEMDSEQYFVRVNSSCARLNSTIGWGGGIYFFNLEKERFLLKYIDYHPCLRYNIFTGSIVSVGCFKKEDFDETTKQYNHL